MENSNITNEEGPPTTNVNAEHSNMTSLANQPAPGSASTNSLDMVNVYKI